MGSVNSLPIISQTKSLIQAITGDLEGAKKTQEAFIFENDLPIISQLSSAGYAIAGDLDKARELQERFLDKVVEVPVLSQLVSAGYAIGGDLDKARDNQERFLENVANFVDQVPGVGHVKGGIHYALGQNEKGDESMKAASHAAGVVIGGTIGLVTGGPVGAVCGGVAGGALMDSVITASELAVHGNEAEPYGQIDNVIKVIKAIDGEEPYTLEDGVELITGPVRDGMIGYRASGPVTKLG